MTACSSVYNQEIYDGLTPEQQAVVDEAGQKAVEYERYINRSGDEEIMNRWKDKNGVTFTAKEDMTSIAPLNATKCCMAADTPGQQGTLPASTARRTIRSARWYTGLQNSAASPRI